MATAKKKTGAKRQVTAPKKSSRSAAAKKTTTTRSRQAPAKRPIRREVGACVCLLLAVVFACGYFDDAPLVAWFCNLFKGLFGYGYWLSVPIMLLCAYILAFHRGRPVRLRLTCALLIPVLLGAVLQAVVLRFGEVSYALNFGMVGQLWTAGKLMSSGGVVCGLIGVFSDLYLGFFGIILLVVGELFALFGAFNRTIGDVIDYIRSRPHSEYELQEEPEKPRRPTHTEPLPEPEPKPRTRVAFDVPLDDGPAAVPAAEKPAEEPQPRKSGFFNRKPNVKAPDEVLTGVSHIVDEPVEPFKEPVAAPMPETEEEAPPAVPEIVREPAVPKVTASEAAQAAQEVAKDIEQTMEQESKPYQ